MAVTTEPKNARDVLLYEMDNRMSRKAVTFASGNTIAVGQVVGKNYKAKTNFTQDSGTNLSTGDVSLSPKAKKGDYTIVGTGADAGYMVDPDGFRVDDFEALPHSGEHLSIDSGSVADGDQYTVTVGDGTGEYLPLDTTAVNGAHEAHGVSIGHYDASSAAMNGVIVDRDAVVLLDGLVWPDGISTANKDAALAELEALGIQAKNAA